MRLKPIEVLDRQNDYTSMDTNVSADGDPDLDTFSGLTIANLGKGIFIKFMRYLNIA